MICACSNYRYRDLTSDAVKDVLIIFLYTPPRQCTVCYDDAFCDTLHKWPTGKPGIAHDASLRAMEVHRKDFSELHDVAEAMVISDGTAVIAKTMGPVAKIAQSSIPDESFENRKRGPRSADSTLIPS